MENTPESSTNSDSQPSHQDQPNADATPAQRPERRGPPPNPLYHPLFLPILLVAFSLWFFYDGFITTNPEMLKHQLFNRVMFGITAVFCLRVVPRGIREYREEQQAKESQSDGNAA